MIIIKKKILLILATLLMGFGTIYKPVQADSGWDSDYDSGWDSGSDWGDSDWSSSSSSSGTYSGSSTSGGFIALVVIIIIVIVIIKSKNNRNGGNGGSSNITNSVGNYKDIDIEKIHSIDKDLNINEFKTKVFKTYKELQTAWMNFDTETIRKLTTDEIYNMYSSQLETLKLKKQKNIMKDIELIDVKIIDIYKENDVITIDTYLNVRCYDYVIKETTGEVVRGKDNAKINIKYKLSFVKSASNNKKEEKCPNCGAPVDIVSSATCPYCDSTLVKDAGDYVMSKKVSLGQTLER
ncbi:MAG: TIM44-like domain-containing protein [Bacilli bacterium]